MDALEIRHALGVAYARTHAQSDRAGAVSELRQKLAHPEARETAHKHLQELAAIVKARSQGAQCGCYLTKTAHDLLAEALHHV